MSNQCKGICEFNENGYTVEGKPVWIASGEFQYFRITKDDWEKRLLQLKLAGLNTVSVYFPWNFHEVEEGVWDFSGDKDAELFLQLAAKVGLYVVARPGPFICNEWQCGGIPAWLTMRKDIRLRTADPQYLSYCDKWWDKIGPIIAKYQLGREGTIILAQVENEYGHVGEHQEPDYIYHLRDGLRSRGVTVPIINCDSFIQFDRIKPNKWEDVNLCCNAGGDGLRVLQRARKMQQDAPLFVTEFWIAAFDWWGRNGSALYDDNRAIYGALEMAAGGAGGLTVFVFSGGSNFGYWHGQSICSDGNFMTTLYGPGAPILDDGRFSGKYNRFKNNFTGLMTASAQLAQADMPEISGDINGVCKAVRRCGDTVFTFYINHSKEQMRIADAQKDQAAVDMSIPAGVVQWKVENLPLKSGYRLVSTTGHLFAGDPALVIYQKEEEKATIRLLAEEGGKEIVLEGVPHADGTPVIWHLHEAGKELTVLLLPERAIDQCFRIDLPGAEPVLVGGVDRIDGVTVDKGRLEIQAYSAVPGACWGFDADGFGEWQPQSQGSAEPWEEALSGTEVSYEFAEAQPDFDDSGWFAAEQPQPMARFGKGNGRAWYRATLDVQTEGWQMLFTSGASDRWMFFVDGKYCVSRGLHTHFGKDCAVYLTKGTHTLAILAENLGMYNTGFEMDIPMGEPKGIYGPVWMNGNEIKNWKMREGLREGETYELWPQAADVPWNKASAEKQKGPCYVKGMFRSPAGFDGAVRVDTHAAGKGSVWINGYNIGRYWKVGPQQSLWIPCGKLKEENEIVLFEEEAISPADIKIQFTPFGVGQKGVLTSMEKDKK